MSDKKEFLSEEDYLLAEVVIKVAAIEKMLVDAGLITTNGLAEQMKIIPKDIVAHMSRNILLQNP
jgi:hypothetical protein